MIKKGTLDFLSKKIFAGGDKGSDIRDFPSNEYLYPVIGNGIENEGVCGYSKNYTVESPAITIAARGSIGATFYRKGKFTPVIRLITIIVDEEKIDTKYLYYLLKSNSFNSTGSVQQQITVPQIKEQVVYYEDDLNLQKKIANQLAFLDKKIINNNKIINELELMAKTLYDYWFLQFEFPNEEGKPYKSSGGKMVYNEELKREIPDGWILKHAVDIAEIKTGKEDANHSTENGQYPFFTCSNDTLKCDDYKFDSNSILIAGNGDFNVKHYNGKFNAYQRTYVITPFDEKYIGLFELCCKQTIERFKKGSNGSIVKFITLRDIQNIQMLDSGDDNLLKPFNNVLEKIDILKRENQELASLRDFLLPMLMNGQVTFKKD